MHPVMRGKAITAYARAIAGDETSVMRRMASLLPEG